MISLEWVKDYIDISDEDLNELAVKITKAGINIESVITKNIPNLVIGYVLECVNHPDSDHLHVCKVEVGDNKVEQIVCGASNVKAGIKVIVALPGAVLPENFEIKKSKIRGVESNGMICALSEIGLEEKTEENYQKGIFILDDEAPVGKDPFVYLGLDDTLYELDIHKHRNNDCYYHIGFAYEIAAILNKKVTLPDDSFTTIDESVLDQVSLDVETKKCPYYLARMVRDIEIKESPEFIKRRLTASGMRPINNVVDISNYVMLEYGQPLHFFDKDKLGSHIVVRDAFENEEIVTLDSKKRILKASDIVITDSTKPVCIAGVMGGENTEVTENTKNILIESAIFDATSIRYTASSLDLRSEASIRYGKGLSYEYTNKAMDRACHLLEKYANAKILSGTVCFDNIDKTDEKVEFVPNDINKMLGITIDEKDMEFELNRLDFPYEIHDGKFIVTIPKRRLDIDPNVNDIAEEIGRLYGYHNLVSTLPKVEIKEGKYIGDVKIRKIVSKRLRSLGLNEAKTYTLVSPEMASIFNYDNKEHVILPNPMSVDKSVVRTSLIPSLVNVYEYNKARKVKDILLYEISKTYDKNYNEDTKVSILMSGEYLANGWSISNKVDFYLIKGIVENIFDYMGYKNRYSFEVNGCKELHPGVSAKILLDRECIGVIGKIHPSVNKDDIYVAEFSMNAFSKKIKPLKYKEASKYPRIEKDMAFVVDKSVCSSDITAVIKKTGGRILSDISVFDVYTGDNIGSDEKSIAYNLTFQMNDRTLTDEEVTKVFENIITEVENKIGAKLRNK